jgi:hypothetical protein
LYTVHNAAGRLQLIVATHVDDLKGAGEPELVKRLLAMLTKAFGPLKCAEKVFEHCGLKHCQTDAGVTVTQAHYAAQLRPIPTATMNIKEINTPLNKIETEAFQSVLGGLSWLAQTRSDICIFVVALQRVATKATTGHVLKVNQLVKYVRRQRQDIFFPKLTLPLKVLCISDAAFRRESSAGLSMRGALVCIAEDRGGQVLGGRMHVIEWYARKQRRIVRSTFSAELNAAADAYETARLICFSLSALYCSGITAKELQRREASGKLPFQITLVVDCQSIFDALSKEQVQLPSEATLILLLLSLKEAMRSFHLRCLAWCDTRDMLADGLGKGSVSRRALVDASNDGVWNLRFAVKTHRERIHHAARSAVQDDLINVFYGSSRLASLPLDW